MQPEPFEFLDASGLQNGELWLELSETKPSDPARRRVPAYIFEMRVEGVKLPVGRIDLRVGNTPDLIQYGGHIGYGVQPEWRGHGFAARSCRLLFTLAKRHGMETIWITCSPDNIASSRTCEKAGGVYIETVEIPPEHDMRNNEGRTHTSRYRFDLTKIDL